MNDQLFDIVFRGDILPGHNIGDVKQRLVQLFKADKERVDALFSGGLVQLKRNIDSISAQKYKTVLIKAGAQVDVVPAGSVSPRVPQRQRMAAERKAQVERSPAGRKTLAQRLAEQERQAQEEKALRERERLAQQMGNQPHWTLAPVGGDLLLASERVEPQARDVDTSRFSLKPMDGDLLEESEKRVFVELELDISALELAEQEGHLLNDDERLALPEVEIDTSSLDLAPLGADLAEAKKHSSPPPPDIGGLTLVN